MILTVSAVLLLVACILFFIAAMNVAAKINLVALGLALWTLSLLIVHHGFGGGP